MKEDKKQKMMKFLITALVVLSLFMQLSLSFAVDSGEEYELELMHYEPFPVKSGQEFEVWFKIKNLMQDEVKPVIVQAVDEFPFQVIGDNQVEIDELRPRDYYTFKFRFKVNDDATQGENKLYLKIKYGNDAFVKKGFDVLITSQSPSVDIKDIETQPEEIVPGKEFKLKVYLSNSDKSAIRNLKVSLDLDNLPFSPLKSSNSKTFDLLEANEQVAAEFNLIADASTSPGVYKIPLTLQYEDVLGNTFTSTQLIGVLLNDVLDNNIEPIIGNANLLLNKESDIDIKFVNKGLSDVKSLIVELLDSPDYDIVGSNKEYIGSIKGDDYDSADFTIVPKKSGKITLKIKYQYLNSMNDFFEKETTLIVTSNDNINDSKSSSVGKIILAIVTIAVVVFAYFKWKKR
ncbi:MAG: hypothetical protein PWP03_232 [Candidatus Woesearchaeota archaeon]|nr:hypothetical protein [Candidatus Woesearchaeota archaeon]MDN5327594.1 hypothetical protein [Candidatus Woesearchaeota archaeon]